jgi:hypothetical protein
MRRKYRRHALAIVMGLALAALAGCNMPFGAQAEIPPATGAIQTVEAELTRVAATSPALPTLPPTLPPTFTPPPSFTPPPTGTSLPTLTPTTVTPCDRAAFVTDVTIPDGTDFAPGQTFTKTWRIRNNGSCTWTSGYHLVFDSGDAMGGPASQQLTTGTVAPGQTIDITVNLTAPGSTGTYRGNWKLRNASGAVFGIGPAANNPFWVEVEVLVPSPVGPNFTVSFENTHICGGTLTYATFRVGNTGSVGFESAQIHIIDQTAASTLYGPASSNNPFMGTASDCPPGGSAMGPGSVYFIAASIGASPPSGNSARLNLRLCTADGLGGTCIDKTADFTVP